MTHVITLQAARRVRADRKTLCRSGFQPLLRILRPRHSHIPVQHKWQVERNARFDVKQGKLLTAEVCTRCGEKRGKRT